MKDDISRSTFRNTKHYRKVRMQQGRVQVDADWNEQFDIQSHYDRTALQDIVGKNGTSIKNDGFRITTNKHSFTIGKGNYYVDGWIAENESNVDGLTDQIPPPAKTDEPITDKPTEDGYYLAYLDVWERHITALDDPLILEPALGGPDTTTRTKIEWQVRLQKIDDPSNSPSISGMKFLSEKSSSGTLQVRTNQSKIISSTSDKNNSDDLCMLPPTSGYRSLENHLYRVEIHKPGSKPGDDITYKFSRDNGSVVAKIVDIVGTSLYISSIGKDITNDLRGQWVEITDDRYDLWGMPGTLVKIKDDSNIQGQLEFDNSSTNGMQITEENFPKQFNPKIRRWDSKDGEQQVLESGTNDDGFLSLENGIEIKFSKHGNYNTGDYWLIPARTGIGDVEWPQNDDDGLPAECQATGIKHHYASLALLQYDKTDGFVSSIDYRNIFPAISDLTVLNYVSGDGQSAGPREILPSPLIVGVTRGREPVEGITVHFEVKKGQGSLFKESSGQEIPIGNQIDYQDIETDLNGLVQCYWQIDHFTDEQQVEASLLDVDGNRIHLPIIFNTKMNKNELPVGLKVHSGLISDEIPNESYKIIGPIYHDIETNALSSAPPLVTLGETNVEPEDGVLRDKVRQIGDLSLLSLFNEQHGFTSPDSVESETLAEHLGLKDVLSDGESASEPLYFKSIMIDEKKFYVLVVNYSQNTSNIQWSDKRLLFTQEKSSTTKKEGFDQVVSAQNDDGSLELFVIGTDDMLWHVQQTVPNGSWGGWAKFPDLKIKQIAVAQNEDGRLEVFAIDDDNGSVWHSTQKTPNGDWENWSSLNGKAKQIQVGKNADGSLELFVIGTDDMLWHVQQTGPNGSWGGWAKFPDLKIKQIAVAQNEDGRLEVFAVPVTSTYTKPGYTFTVSPDVKANLLATRYKKITPLVKYTSARRISKKSKRSPKYMRYALGSNITKTLAKSIPVKTEIDSAIYNPGTMVLTEKASVLKPSVKANTPLWHIYQIATQRKSWSDWNPIAGVNVSQVAVAQNSDGQLEVFAIDKNDLLWHTMQKIPNSSSSWNSWSRLYYFKTKLGNLKTRFTRFIRKPSSIKIKQVTVTQNADGNLELFALEKDTNEIWHVTQSELNDEWDIWSKFNNTAEKIHIAQNADGRLELFTIDSNNLSSMHQLITMTKIMLRWWAIPSVDIPTNFEGMKITEKETKEEVDEAAKRERDEKQKRINAEKEAEELRKKQAKQEERERKRKLAEEEKEKEREKKRKAEELKRKTEEEKRAAEERKTNSRGKKTNSRGKKESGRSKEKSRSIKEKTAS